MGNIFEISKENICTSAKKLRDVYEMKADAPLFQKEFGFYSFEAWREEGKLEAGQDEDSRFLQYIRELFGLDEPGNHLLGNLGECEGAFYPVFEEAIIEDRGDHELVMDFAGRHVLFFKGRRNGFMPEYLDHPVKDIKTWEEKCKWRLNPKVTGRYADLKERMELAQNLAKKGVMITQNLVGPYMFLRSLMGPVDLLYKFYDDPLLIHECMKTWVDLADGVISRHQEHVTLDELYFDENITYNMGPLISPDMIREFLFPYYQQLITNIKARQLDKNRKLYIQVDTDGYSPSVIPVYQEIGMNVMCPFEVAAGCDVVEIGKKYPDLIMSGGIDKRVLSQGKEEIDRFLDHVLPVMKKRGGYIPTCDHGVPAEVSFDNYMHYRKRCLEYS